MRPMFATRGTSVPAGPDWLHEVKWDGMRVLVEVAGDRVRTWSRNENDVTVSFPELRGLGESLGHDVLLDGEVVAFDDGVPSFGALAERMHVHQARRADQLAVTRPVTLLVFDLLRLDGTDLCPRPLTERRRALEDLGLDDARWQVPATYDDGAMLLRATAEQRLEGVVSKRRASTYAPGRRSTHWLKFPHRATGSYVVGGWRLETDSDSRLGAVLVGLPGSGGGGLRYHGRVGSGIAGRTGQALLERLRPLAAPSSPFADPVPRVDAAGTTWLRPEVVVEVIALGLTRDGRLRQPSYIGVRPDLGPGDLAPAEPEEGR